jgi:hypothetical protein
MSKTPEEAAEEQRQKDLDRQWIETYKKYQALINKAKAELVAE